MTFLLEFSPSLFHVKIIRAWNFQRAEKWGKTPKMASFVSEIGWYSNAFLHEEHQLIEYQIWLFVNSQKRIKTAIIKWFLIFWIFRIFWCFLRFIFSYFFEKSTRFLTSFALILCPWAKSESIKSKLAEFWAEFPDSELLGLRFSLRFEGFWIGFEDITGLYLKGKSYWTSNNL